MSTLRKIAIMALLGGLGAAGGAGLGEPLFHGPQPERPEPRRVCLLFDVSRSMDQMVARPDGRGRITQLEALQEAATGFVARQDLAVDRIGLTSFSWDARVVEDLTQDEDRLAEAIGRLRAAGGTNLGRGLDRARGVLEGHTGERWILLFTDGKPESSSTRERPEAAALSAARRARDRGIQIVAIGTGLADAQLLERITGSPDKVIISDPQALHDAFRRSEALINRQMLSTTASTGTLRRNATLTGVWASLIAIGAALGMVVGQNRHLHRRLLRIRDAVVVVIGGVLAGLLAGAASQSLFHALAELSDARVIGRVAAWTLLGGGVGYGMGFFMPNLRRKRAAVAGAFGGIGAAFSFVSLVPEIGDTYGRLLGAAILGACTGLTTVLVETVHRRAWLVVHWGKNESSSLPLGETPILVGSAASAHVLLPESHSPSPVMARIKLSEGVIGLEDPHGGRDRTLADGETLQFGNIAIEVRAAGSNAHATTAAR